MRSLLLVLLRAGVDGNLPVVNHKSKSQQPAPESGPLLFVGQVLPDVFQRARAVGDFASGLRLPHGFE